MAIFRIFFLLLLLCHHGLIEKLGELIPDNLFGNVYLTKSYFLRIISFFEELSKAIRLVWKGCLIDLEAMSHFCTNKSG